MKFLIISILALICFLTISARPLENKKGDKFLRGVSLLLKEKGTSDFSSMKTMLIKYVEKKYPAMEERKRSRIVKILAQRIKNKVYVEIKKKKLKSPWFETEDTFARILK